MMQIDVALFTLTMFFLLCILIGLHKKYFQIKLGISTFFIQFSCFLSECDQKSTNPTERRDHCIKDHKFPHDFRFYKVSSQKKSEEGKLENNENAMEVEGQTTKKPTTIYNFGHSKHRSFKPVKTPKIKTDILESNQMVVDLLENLPK